MDELYEAEEQRLPSKTPMGILAKILWEGWGWSEEVRKQCYLTKLVMYAKRDIYKL